MFYHLSRFNIDFHGNGVFTLIYAYTSKIGSAEIGTNGGHQINYIYFSFVSPTDFSSLEGRNKMDYSVQFLFLLELTLLS